jgi:hypothetical protein
MSLVEAADAGHHEGCRKTLGKDKALQRAAEILPRGQTQGRISIPEFPFT